MPTIGLTKQPGCPVAALLLRCRCNSSTLCCCHPSLMGAASAIVKLALVDTRSRCLVT
jgi:hypothetical protein